MTSTECALCVSAACRSKALIMQRGEYVWTWHLRVLGTSVGPCACTYLRIFLISSGVQICWYAGKETDKPLKSSLQEFNMLVVRQLKTCFIQNTRVT